MVISKWNKWGVSVVSILGFALTTSLLGYAQAPLLFPFSNIIIPVLLGVGVFISLFLLLPRQRTILDDITNLEGFGVDIRVVVKWLVEEESKLRNIRKLANRLDQTSKEKVIDIIEIAEKLFENVKIDPSSYRDVRRVLGLYLNSTVEILEKVELLMRKSLDNRDNSAMVNKLNSTLEELEDSFKGLANRMIARDSLKLDIELDVFKERLSSDGLTVKE